MAFSTKVEKICSVCQKQFLVVKSREHTATVCSRECKGKITAEKYRSARIKRNCLVCNKEMEVLPSRDAKGIGKYCSYSCHNLAMAQQEHKTWADGNESFHTGGYVLIHEKMHPYSVASKVFKHRLVMEEKMRREVPSHKFLIEICGDLYLRREIQVHHIDEIKTNNDEENLIACTAAAHSDMHNDRPVLEGEIYPDHDWIKKREYRGVKCVCQNCQKEFFSTPSSIADGRGKNCSVQCSREYRSKQTTLTLVCNCCKKEFNMPQSQVALGRGKFCSDECRFKGRKGHDKKYVFEHQSSKP